MFLADKQKSAGKIVELRLFTNIAEATALTSWNNEALSRRKNCPKLGRAINACSSDKKSGEIGFSKKNRLVPVKIYKAACKNYFSFIVRKVSRTELELIYCSVSFYGIRFR